MKTAEEILKTKPAIPSGDITKELTFHYEWNDAIKAMEEYAKQFKYDYSMECECDNSPGSTWCCNLCGLPTIKHKSKINQ